MLLTYYKWHIINLNDNRTGQFPTSNQPLNASADVIVTA